MTDERGRQHPTPDPLPGWALALLMIAGILVVIWLLAPA